MKCNFLHDSALFLGHNMFSADSSKVDVIHKMSKLQLMEDDDCTPSVKWIKLFLGIIYY